MLAADVEQAIRLLRNFRVDVVICMGMAMEAVRKISERAPTVVVGDSEPDAWNAGAAGFAATGSAIVAVPELAYRVARGERGIRIA
jgi:hypothetical protein